MDGENPVQSPECRDRVIAQRDATIAGLHAERKECLIYLGKDYAREFDLPSNKQRPLDSLVSEALAQKDNEIAERDATIREQGAKIAELIKACKVKDGQLEKAQVANKRHQRNKKSWSRYKQQRDGEIATLRRLLGEVCEAEQRMRELFNTATWLKLCNVSEAARAFLSSEQTLRGYESLRPMDVSPEDAAIIDGSVFGKQPAEATLPRNLLAGSPMTVHFISNGIREGVHGEQPKAKGDGKCNVE
jgi:hypothetical protein